MEARANSDVQTRWAVRVTPRAQSEITLTTLNKSGPDRQYRPGSDDDCVLISSNLSPSDGFFPTRLTGWRCASLPCPWPRRGEELQLHVSPLEVAAAPPEPVCPKTTVCQDDNPPAVFSQMLSMQFRIQTDIQDFFFFKFFYFNANIFQTGLHIIFLHLVKVYFIECMYAMWCIMFVFVDAFRPT